ncbi:MAG: rod shape-determining protein RodA [Flavobacteriaceae bacterium]
MRQESNIIFKLDWILILLFLALIGFGWLNIFAASIDNVEDFEVFDLSTQYGKQLVWIGMSFVIIFIILLLDSKLIERFSGIIYVTSMLSLAGLFLFGKNINGATSWYGFGSFTLQPSEFAKMATCLALARLLSDRQFDLKYLSNQTKALTLLLIPAFLITIQPDPGSAIVYISLFYVLYREGLPGSYLGVGLLAITLFILTLIFGFRPVVLGTFATITLILIYIQLFTKYSLKFQIPKVISVYLICALWIGSVSYVFNNVFEQRHRDRFSLLLGQKSDTQGIGYNTNQSILTISSGGFGGKGFLNGDRTQGNFVPEQSTDYIFSTIGEEWGFVGSTLVVLLWIIFILRIIYAAEKQRNNFTRIYGYGIASIFFFHFFINIGMVIGLLPTIGIPLPFFSYGGSGLWGFTLLLFIFIKLDAAKDTEW